MTKANEEAGGSPAVDEHEKRIRAEVTQLLSDIKRIGPTYPSPQPRVLFSELFDDEFAQNYYEALVGTLKCAKKRGLIRFDGQVLLRGVHDNVVISIAGESPPPPMRLRKDGLLEPTNPESSKDETKGGKEVNPKLGRRWSKDRAVASITSTGSPIPKAKSPISKSRSPLPKGKSPLRKGGSGAPSGIPLPPTLHLYNDDAQDPQKSKRHPAPTTTTSKRPPFSRLNSAPSIQTSVSDDNATVGDSTSPTTQASKVISPTAQTETAGIVFRSIRTSSAQVAKSVEVRLSAEIARLPSDIARVGGKDDDAGRPQSCTFGELFDDDEVQNHYEALVGTLKSAKKRGIVTFKGQMLLKGMHDNVIISVVEKEAEQINHVSNGIDQLKVENKDVTDTQEEPDTAKGEISAES